MELRAFNHQMARLAAAFNHPISSHTQTVYWERLQKHSEPAFEGAVNKLLDTEQRFPPIGKIKDALRTSREVEDRRAPDIERPPHPPVSLASLDLASVRAVPTPHRIESRGHEAWLRAVDRYIALLEARLSERLAQLEENPHDADLERRVGVIGRTLSYQCQWREHFARTGESLIWEVGP